MNKIVEIEKILTEKPGCIKLGVKRLTEKFETTEEIVNTVLAKLKNKGVKATDYKKLVSKKSLKKDKNILEKVEIIKDKTKLNKENVLVIGDLHAPFTRRGYLKFCKETQVKYSCGTVVFIGDILDNHFSSYHEIVADGKSAKDELDLAVEMLMPWHNTFPEAKVCIGNHDAIVLRKANTAGISKRWIRDFSDVLETPGWDWQMEHELNGVLYVHGTGSSGDKAAINRAMNLRQSVVQGHLHTTAGVTYNASKKDLIYGFQVGCGVDDTAYAMEYAKHNIKKSIIGCGVVLDKGKIPIFIPMEI